MQKGLGRAWPGTEEKYNRGRETFYNYENGKRVELEEDQKMLEKKREGSGAGKVWVRGWGMGVGRSDGMKAFQW